MKCWAPAGGAFQVMPQLFAGVVADGEPKEQAVAAEVSDGKPRTRSMNDDRWVTDRSTDTSCIFGEPAGQAHAPSINPATSRASSASFSRRGAAGVPECATETPS